MWEQGVSFSELSLTVFFLVYFELAWAPSYQTSYDNFDQSDGDSDHSLAYVAAASGDVPLLVKAIQQDPGIIQQLDKDGNTLLAHAVHAQHLDVMKRLVQMGADVNAQDSQGRTYLAIAAYQGWHEGVMYLLRKGAKQAIVDKSGRTPLHAATYNTDSRSLVALLKRLSVKDVNAVDNERMTALHWAAFHDRPENVRELLHKGAYILAQDIDGKTALHWAVQNDSRNCCLLLAEHGISFGLLTALDNSSKNVVHLAAAAGKALIISDFAKLMPELLEGEDKDKRTPLHWAAAIGHSNCVKALLEHNVAPNNKDIDGTTPLQYARQANHTLCVTMLEEHLGMRRNQKGKSGNHKSKSCDTKLSSSSGFFKGLFGRKEKQKETIEYRKETESHYLPEVNVDTKCTQRTNGNDVDKGLIKVTSIRQASNKYSRISAGALKDQHEDNDKFSDDRVPEYLKAHEQSEHRKKRKKHKKKKDSEGERCLSPNTVKSSSTSREGDYPKSPNLRTTHLSPISYTRPHSISPRLNIPTLDLNLPMKRQGELSPLGLDRQDSGSTVKMRSPLPKQLNQLREPCQRTPTPPPFKAPLRKKALPEISPLTQNMSSLQMDTDGVDSEKPYNIHHETDLSYPVTPETPGIHGNLRKLAKVSEESDYGNIYTNADADAYSDSRFVRTIHRYPSDDAISLYKLSNAKVNKHAMLDDGLQGESMT